MHGSPYFYAKEMNEMAITKETDLYQPVRKLFPVSEAYPEVVMRRGRPDVVFKDTDVITVVELKTSLSLALIEQAYNWVNTCDYIYVAVPRPRKVNKFAVRLLSDKGIGLILVGSQGARFHTKASKQERKTIPWTKYLHEFYKLNESGGTAGGYMTGYKYTIQCVKALMKTQSRPLTVKEIVEKVDGQYEGVASKHYKNPHSSLRSALTEYESEWCDRTLEGGRVKFEIRK